VVFGKALHTAQFGGERLPKNDGTDRKAGRQAREVKTRKCEHVMQRIRV